MSDSIYLDLDDQDVQANQGSNIDNGAFDGRSRMGAGTLGADGEQDYPYNGTWSGMFYNAVMDDDDTADVDESTMPPGSVAGTFGVTMTDDMGTADDMDDDTTESYVGAFGAHKTQ